MAFTPEPAVGDFRCDAEGRLHVYQGKDQGWVFVVEEDQRTRAIREVIEWMAERERLTGRATSYQVSQHFGILLEGRAS